LRQRWLLQRTRENPPPPWLVLVVFHCSGKIKWMLLEKKCFCGVEGQKKRLGGKFAWLRAGGYFVFPCIVRSLPVPDWK
jgi:hypothetical protein